MFVLPKFAVMVTATCAETGSVEIGNVADVKPAVTTTEVGGITLAFDEARDIVIPEVGAGLEIVTVPVEEAPPYRFVGLMEKLASAGELMTSDLLFVLTNVPLMFAVVAPVTGTVVMANVVAVNPAGIVTLGGTIAFTLSELNVTVAPFDGAGPLSVTVPVEDVPPCRLFGERAMAAKLGCATIRLYDLVAAPRVAEIFRVTVLDTGIVVMGNVTVVAPPGTVTDACTVAAEPLDASETAMPLGGAGLNNVTLPLVTAPPVTELGEIVMK